MNAPVVDIPEMVEPPIEDGDGEGGSNGVYVTASVTVFGVHRTSHAFFPDQPDDVELASELYNVMAAVAQMQGSGVWLELQRKFTDCG